MKRGITRGLRGRDKFYATRQHRIDKYCEAYRRLLDGTCDLAYFNGRLAKLVEVLPEIGPRGKNGS